MEGEASDVNGFGIFLLMAGVGCLLGAGFFLAVTVIFLRIPSQTAKTAAKLATAKQRDNVYLGRKPQFFRHITQATYRYFAEGKSYRIRDMRGVTKRQMPLLLPVIYWKCFPRFAYVDDICSLGVWRYFVPMSVCLALAIPLLALGIAIL